MKYCTKCGESIEDDAKFCTNCGENLEGKNTKESNLGKLAVLIGVAIVVILLGTVGKKHHCDWCNKDFRGTAYYDCYEPDVTFCEDCAKEYYVLGGYQNYKK